MTVTPKNQFYSLQSRLMLMAVAVVLLPMLLATVFGFYSQKRQIDHSLSRELNTCLGACVLYYQNLQEKLEMMTLATSTDNTCKTTLRLGVLPQLQKQITSLAQDYHMDFLLVTDLGGKVVASYPAMTDDKKEDHNISLHPLTMQALQGKKITTTLQEQHPLLTQLTAPSGEGNQPQITLLLESAMPIMIRESPIGTILAGTRLSGNDQMMQAMQKASGADRTALAMNDEIIAASYQPLNRFNNSIVNKLSAIKLHGAPESLSSLTCPLDKKEKVFKWVEIMGINKEPVATLVTIMDYDRAGTLIRKAVLNIISIFLAGMVLAAIIAFVVARSIAAPVKVLSTAMKDMETGVLEQAPVPVTRKDEIGSLIQGFNNMTVRLQAYLHDLKMEIDERRKAERSLADEKERLAVTLGSIGDAVITTDTRGNIVFINKVAEELTGWTNQEAQGEASTRIFHIINDKTGLRCADPVQSVLEQGRIVGLANHTALIAKDGNTCSIADSGAPIRDRQGGIIGVVIVFRDITHEQRMENELLKIKKLESIGVLAGGIAHDFNNILSAILGNIELTSRMIGTRNEKAASLLGEAKKAVLRAVSLTKQLLTFSKGGDPIKDTTSLPELIRDSADFVLRGSHVSCEYHFPQDLWMADIDSGQISQVIQNIIINAKYAMPQGGKVLISGANINDPAAEAPISLHDGNLVRITIKDTGSGIPPEIIDKIFDPYFTTREEGSGLGLAICHSIISKHEGSLTVHSEPGLGATFTIYLPANPGGSITGQQPQAPSPSAVRGARVMVLDDEEILRDIVKLQLEILGHEAVLVKDGEEAINRYQELQAAGTPADLVIMDLTIPAGMGGKEAATVLLAKDPDARLIVASGYSNDPVMANYRDYGFRAALSKPFDLDGLSKGIDQALQ
ncbi:MAG: ATP-binding protein [Pseudomonadota bacterium]